MNYVVFPCLTCFILIFGIVSLMPKQSGYGYMQTFFRDKAGTVVFGK